MQVTPEGEVPLDGGWFVANLGRLAPRRAVTWIANATAARYGASVERTTTRDSEAYGDLPAVRRVPAPRPFGSG